MKRTRTKMEPPFNDLRFQVDIPPSANRLWKFVGGRKPYPSVEYDIWRSAAEWEIAARGMPNGWRLYNGPIRVTIRAGKVRGDLDNRIKPILDAIQRSGCIANDSQAHHIDAMWSGEVAKGKVAIHVCPIFPVSRASVSERRAA